MTSPAGPALPPLRVGVALAPAFARRGVSQADARAYDAAGCDSLWLEGDEEPWLAAAALAMVTLRARLIVPVATQDLSAAAALRRRAATLQRLAPDRVALWCEADVQPAELRAAVSLPVFCAAAAADALSADGLVVPEASAGPLPASAAVWLRCASPGDRTAWRQLRERARGLGAAGLIVPETPRLLDLLRNPDQEDERSDLRLAHG